VLYYFSQSRRRKSKPRAKLLGEITMSRTTNIFSFVFVSLVSVFATGCMGESEDPNGIVWYDDEMNACFTTNDKGQRVQVPCDDTGARPDLDTSAANQGAGCTGTACCQAIEDDGGICPK
jgi:hypothetical protein